MYSLNHPKPIRVLVADDSRMHTQLLADAICRDGEVRVVASVCTSSDLLAATEAYDVDVALVSSSLEEQPEQGCQIIREVRALRPACRVVILLDTTRREETVQAFQAGARGTFSRHDPAELLSKCIRVVHSGEIWANKQQMSYLVELIASTPAVHAVDANGMNLLSARELEVVRHLSAGLTNREIASQLGLSQHTVKNYLSNIFEKLGVSSRVELLYLTLAAGSASSEIQAHKGASYERSYEQDREFGQQEFSLACSTSSQFDRKT